MSAVLSRPTCDARVLRGTVICSRCGAPMSAEQVWENEPLPLLVWRCEIGHITQAVPLPESVVQAAQLVRPILRQ